MNILSTEMSRREQHRAEWQSHDWSAAQYCIEYSDERDMRWTLNFFFLFSSK